MLPSSSSQLARFGQINHYKKFWLLQTQLEKQEQTSTALSLGVSGNANVKESKPLISSNALIANGDHLINTNNIAGHGTCRGDIVTSSASSSRAAAFPYCSNEPGSLKFYTAYTPVISNGRSKPADSPALSLAVNCESVSQPHPINFFNQTWSPSSLSSPASALQSRTSPNLESTHACNSGQVKATLGVEECDSSECSNKKGLVCDNASTSASTSSISLSSKQHHKLTGLRCNDSGSIIPSSLQVVAALPSSSRSGHGSTGPLRTCSLCGTSKTPLWRSGPDGPKSLCNACGIRVKKTKRLQAAMEAAGAGPEGIMSAPSAAATGAYKRLLAATTKAGGGRGGTTHKRKLSMEAAENQSDPIFQLRKKKKKAAGNRRSSGCSGQQPNIAGLESGICYRVFGDASANLAGGSLLAGDSTSSKKLSSLFAKDVEEAAILLMALSCGLVLS